MKLLVLMSLLLAIACNSKEDSKPSKTYGPLCALANATPTLILCIEFNKGTAADTVDSDCAREKTYYSSIGASTYLTVDEGTTFCNTVQVAGKCVFVDRVITFYTPGFPDAEGECTSRGGEFQ